MQRIAQIDHLLSIQLNEILHHPSVPEAGRHLARLEVPDGSDRDQRPAKIKILNVSKKELLRDLQRAPEFDQSALFKKVYEEEFGIFGGAPFASIIGDYEFGRGPEDIELLERISQVAAGRARAVPLGGLAGDVQHGELRHAGCSARYRQGLRHHRIRQVEELPAERRFALRRSLPAAHSDAPAVRQERTSRWKRSNMKRTWTAPITTSISGAMRPTPWARA